MGENVWGAHQIVFAFFCMSERECVSSGMWCEAVERDFGSKNCFGTFRHAITYEKCVYKSLRSPQTEIHAVDIHQSERV